MNRLGIFGGSFDPPHVGHLQVALQAADELQLDAVLWIPASVSPHKTIETTLPASVRYEMVQLMTKLDNRFLLDSRELDRKGPSFTVDTVEELSQTYPDASLYLIIGEDSFLSLPRWKNPERIMELAQLVVYKRVTPQKGLVGNTHFACDHWLDGPPVDVTSTEIKDLLFKNKNADHLLTPEVSAFIKENGLYQK